MPVLLLHLLSWSLYDLSACLKSNSMHVMYAPTNAGCTHDSLCCHCQVIAVRCGWPILQVHHHGETVSCFHAVQVTLQYHSGQEGAANFATQFTRLRKGTRWWVHICCCCCCSALLPELMGMYNMMTCGYITRHCPGSPCASSG